MKIQYYSAKGVKTKTASLPKSLSEKVNEDLLAQAFHVYRDRQHTGVSKTKTRGEVSRTTAKWYKQKGTGRARHGSRSAPIFVGGGKAHGAKGLSRTLKLSKALKNKALLSAINWKTGENQVVVVSDIKTLKKTKDTAMILVKLMTDYQSKNVTFVFSKDSLDKKMYFRNIPYCKTVLANNLNAYNVLLGGLLVFEEKALKDLEAKIK